MDSAGNVMLGGRYTPVSSASFAAWINCRLSTAQRSASLPVPLLATAWRVGFFMLPSVGKSAGGDTRRLGSDDGMRLKEGAVGCGDGDGCSSDVLPDVISVTKGADL